MELEEKTLLREHDKKIDKLEHSIEQLNSNISSLTTAVGTYARKMDDIASLMNAQNLLMERFTNMDKDLKEAFTRAHIRIDKLEAQNEKYNNIMNNTGCPTLRLEAEKLTVLHTRISDIENAITWINRIVVGQVILAVVGLVIMKSLK